MPIVRFLISFRNKVAKSIYSVYYYVKEIAMKITEDDIKSWVTIILGIIWYSIGITFMAFFLKSSKLLMKLRNLYGDTTPTMLNIWFNAMTILCLLIIWWDVKHPKAFTSSFLFILIITLINYWFYYTYK